jgi:hypothetical protein
MGSTRYVWEFDVRILEAKSVPSSGIFKERPTAEFCFDLMMMNLPIILTM